MPLSRSQSGRVRHLASESRVSRMAAKSAAPSFTASSANAPVMAATTGAPTTSATANLAKKRLGDTDGSNSSPTLTNTQTVLLVGGALAAAWLLVRSQ